MSLLHVSEYADIDRQAGGTIGSGATLARYTVNFAAGVAYSPPFQRKTRFIRIESDAICAFVVSQFQQVTYQSTGAAIGTATGGAPQVSGFTTGVSSAGITPVAATAADERLDVGEERWLEVGADLCISVITST